MATMILSSARPVLWILVALATIPPIIMAAEALWLKSSNAFSGGDIAMTMWGLRAETGPGKDVAYQLNDTWWAPSITLAGIALFVVGLRSLLPVGEVSTSSIVAISDLAQHLDDFLAASPEGRSLQITSPTEDEHVPALTMMTVRGDTYVDLLIMTPQHAASLPYVSRIEGMGLEPNLDYTIPDGHRTIEFFFEDPAEARTLYEGLIAEVLQLTGEDEVLVNRNF